METFSLFLFIPSLPRNEVISITKQIASSAEKPPRNDDAFDFKAQDSRLRTKNSRLNSRFSSYRHQKSAALIYPRQKDLIKDWFAPYFY